MKTIAILKNSIQEYAWGSHTAIPDLLGKPHPWDRPQAELWMGTHPKAPSQVRYEGQSVSLSTLIETYPQEILGNAAAQKFDNHLPYLFKVLAAAKPLSIQAHPSREQAKEGFEREDRLDIPLDAPDRNYKDDRHKPECICALTPFWGLNGFRRIPDILFLMERTCSKRVTDEFADILNSKGTKGLFHTLMTMDDARKNEVVEDAVGHATASSKDDPVSEWIIRLYDEYPGNIGVLSPLFLNLICLEPGQAMFLPAGELHSYLDGLGIELMANSDNVLRGGLTLKHMDVPALLQTLNFDERVVNVLSPRKISDYEGVYDTPAQEFLLSIVYVRQDEAMCFNTSIEILFCTEGRARITDFSDHPAIEMTKGISVIIPAAVGRYAIEGDAVFYKASVPET